MATEIISGVMNLINAHNGPVTKASCCPALPKASIRDFTQMLKVLTARLETRLQTALHADHDVAARFGCDGDKDLPDTVSVH